MKAKVIRGVYIRGKPHGPGAIGSVRTDGVVQPGDAFVVSHQEFAELCTTNYLVKHDEPPVVQKPVAPVVAPPAPEVVVESKKAK